MATVRKAKTDPVEIVTDDNPDQPVVIEIDDIAPVELETEIKLAPEPPQPDADDAVKKALEATQRAETLLADANRRADEQSRIARQREEELTRERGDRVDAEYNSVLTAIAAEQSALEQAESAYTQSAAAGDWAAAGKAQSAIARATARIDRLEDNKVTFDSRREADKKTQTRTEPASPDFETQIRALPEPARNWLRSHPEFWNDPVKNGQIQGLHGYLTRTKGIPEFSKEYFDEVEVQLGLRTQAPETQPQRRSMTVSPPVSREVPGPSGQRMSSRITLSPAEREIARKSFTAPDMTDEQKERLYALNKAKLIRKRANGEYHHTTEQTG